MTAHKEIMKQLGIMRITNILQTGHIHVGLTEELAKYGKVIFLTESELNLFKDNPNVELIKGTPHSIVNSFKKKFGILDVCVNNNVKDWMEIRLILCALVPLIRKNGKIFFVGSYNEEYRKVIEDYIHQIDNDYFEVTYEETLITIKVL